MMETFKQDKQHGSGPPNCCCSQPFIFRHGPTELLYQDYTFHIRRAAIATLLGIYILLTAVLSILYFAYQKKATEDNLYHAGLCLFAIISYIFVNTKFLKNTNHLKIVSYMLWVLLLLFAFKSLPLGTWTNSPPKPIYAAAGLWQVMFSIYCMFLIPPINFFMNLIFGMVLSGVYIGVLLIRMEDHSEQWKELIVNAVLLLVINAVGIMVHRASEKSQRKSFINCRGFVGAKMEAEDQCGRLAKIMELCLPKFMCAEVCADLTMYNDCVGPRRTFSRVYDCVCFSCINITGLDQLKSQLDATQYLSIISDLCNTFDTLCEVHNCLPIVSLGDSFTAVNGLPISDPEGAKACVLLCLDMLQAVQVIRQTKGTAVEALTGVHYGSITTGVVGTYRWKYKCCGNDLLLAKHVAITGSPGRVHITEPCVRFLPLDSFDIQQSTISHGISVPTYFLKSRNTRRVHPAVMKLNKRMSHMDSVTSFLRLDSNDESEPFYRQLSRSGETRSGFTNRLFDGKAFGRRSTHDVANDSTNKTFHLAISNGSIEQETTNVMSFFTLRFLDRSMESSFGKEYFGFGLTLAFFLLILAAITVLHFMMLPRTMLFLASQLFLFLMVSLLLISLLASKLKVLKGKCFTSSTNKLALTILIISLTSCTALVNVLSCEGSDFYPDLPSMLKYGIVNSDPSDAQCSSPFYVFLSVILLTLMIPLTQLTHIVQSIILIVMAVGYAIVITYTHPGIFAVHDDLFREVLPPSSIMALVAIIHFIILHVLTGRHLEWVRRLDHLWRHKELMEYQQAQDMVTLRQGVVNNTLPTHVLSYYSSLENDMRAYTNTHSLAGVAFVTIPNFPALVAEMDRSKQSLDIIQILHDITTAFDHLLRRSDFRVVEKVYDQDLTLVLVSGVNDSMGPLHQGMEHEFAMFHLCKLLDLLLDMKHCLTQLNAMSGRSLIMRAGVSMGITVEGAFGHRRPQYNIWGPAVEMARKLEMTGKINHIQINKEMAQCLRQQFQFQPRAQTSMPVLAELQPYYLLGRRLQSVIGSDNVSLASNISKARSPNRISMGSISQAETILASSQQPLLNAMQSRTRTMSGDSAVFRTDAKMPSANTTPSSSIGRQMNADSFRDSLHSWKLPQVPSLSKLTNPSRPMSPELPTVHYSKVSTPPSGRLPHIDSRGMIILTQANLSGDNLPGYNQTSNSLSLTSKPEDLIVQQPASAFSPPSQPKLANVISTNSMRGVSPKRSTQLSPVGELSAVNKDSDALIQGKITLQSPKLLHGLVRDGGLAAPHYNGLTNGHHNPGQSSPHQNDISPQYTECGTIYEPNVQPFQVENATETEPLLKENDGVVKKKPVITGLDKLMQSSLFSDRMQSSMEGNVSSTSTSPDEGLIMFQPHNVTSDDKKLVEGDPSLSPLLKHQLQRFAKKIETPHKSPHLPRKSSKTSPFSTGSRGSNAINSLASPTHSQSTVLSAASPHSMIIRNDFITDNLYRQRNSSSSSSKHSKHMSRSPRPISDISSEDEDNSTQPMEWAGARPKQIPGMSGPVNQLSPPPLLTMPPPPADAATESELSDDDNHLVNCNRNNDLSATDYDNMYSTDNGTYDRHYIHNSSKRNNHTAVITSKFASKLAKMQNSSRSIKDLYSEIESDAADCESLVGDTDYETEMGPPAPNSKDYNHPLQKLQWTENKLLALLKPASTTPRSTMGSSLRHCRSMELLPTENADLDTEAILKRLPQKPSHGRNRYSQNFDDNASVLSSQFGSEFSRSDPNLSDSCAYESEYDNYRPGMTSDEDFFAGEPISDIDLSQFDDIDFDKIKISENMTTEDYMQSLQQQIEHKQKLQHAVTNV